MPGKRTLAEQLPGVESSTPVQRPVPDDATIEAIASLRTASRPTVDALFGSHLVARTGEGAAPTDAASRSDTGAGARLVPRARRPGGLPDDVRARMEDAFGAGFSQVCVHESSEAAALGARAITRGAEIFFAPGQFAPGTERGDELLGHELAHVLQQRAGRVANGIAAPAMAKPLASLLAPGPFGASDHLSLEREADQAGARVARGQKVQIAGAERTAVSDGAVMAQADFTEHAEEFERWLGLYLFTHPRALAAVAQLADTLAQRIRTQSQPALEEPELDDDALDDGWEAEENKLYQRGKGWKSEAGAVGPEPGAIKQALLNGNLRERLTAIYNYMTRSVRAGEFQGVRLETEAPARTKLQERDKTRTRRARNARGPRVAGRLKHDDFRNRRGALLIGQQEGAYSKLATAEDTLPWSEGKRTFMMNEQDPWVQAMRQLGLPLAAGPSGHANVFMQTNQLLGTPARPADLRLACIAYTLPIHAHTLVEVLETCSAYPGCGFTPGPAMYRQLLPEQELRTHVCPGALFPEEHVVLATLQPDDLSKYRRELTQLVPMLLTCGPEAQRTLLRVMNTLPKLPDELEAWRLVAAGKQLRALITATTPHDGAGRGAQDVDFAVVDSVIRSLELSFTNLTQTSELSFEDFTVRVLVLRRTLDDVRRLLGSGWVVGVARDHSGKPRVAGGLQRYVETMTPLLLCIGRYVANGEHAIENIARVDPDLTGHSLVDPSRIRRDDQAQLRTAVRYLRRWIRAWRKRKAYERLRNGEQWISAGLAQRASGPNPIEELSHQNVARLVDELIEDAELWQPIPEELMYGRYHVDRYDPDKHDLDDEYGELGLLREEVPLYQALVSLPFTAVHATNSYRAIENTGELVSAVELQRSQPSFVPEFSTPGNIKDLANDDFVFFRYAVGDDAVETRFGKSQMVFDADLLEDDGWISLHDQLKPLSSESMRALHLEGTQLFGEPFGQQLVRTTTNPDNDRARLEHTYGLGDPGAKQLDHVTGMEESSFLDEVFYGREIRPGLALSIIRTLRKIPSLRDEALARYQKPGYLARLVSRLYRPEGKYPASVRLAEHPTRTVHNPQGDGRYRDDASPEPELMAEAKAAEQLRMVQLEWRRFWMKYGWMKKLGIRVEQHLQGREDLEGKQMSAETDNSKAKRTASTTRRQFRGGTLHKRARRTLVEDIEGGYPVADLLRHVPTLALLHSVIVNDLTARLASQDMPDDPGQYIAGVCMKRVQDNLDALVHQYAMAMASTPGFYGSIEVEALALARAEQVSIEVRRHGSAQVETIAPDMTMNVVTPPHSTPVIPSVGKPPYTEEGNAKNSSALSDEATALLDELKKVTPLGGAASPILLFHVGGNHYNLLIAMGPQLHEFAIMGDGACLFRAVAAGVALNELSRRLAALPAHVSGSITIDQIRELLLRQLRAEETKQAAAYRKEIGTLLSTDPTVRQAVSVLLFNALRRAVLQAFQGL